MVRRGALGLMAAPALLASPAARADIAPPQGYAEKCTVEEQQRAGETCAACPGDYRDFDACREHLGPQGYE